MVPIDMKLAVGLKGKSAATLSVCRQPLMPYCVSLGCRHLVVQMEGHP